MEIRELHKSLRAQFGVLNGLEVVTTYGDLPGECRALVETAGVMDLSARGRLCVVGADRHRFLHGQVTNEVAKLPIGEGCFAGLVSAKGRSPRYFEASPSMSRLTASSSRDEPSAFS